MFILNSYAPTKTVRSERNMLRNSPPYVGGVSCIGLRIWQEVGEVGKKTCLFSFDLVELQQKSGQVVKVVMQRFFVLIVLRLL